MYPISFQKGDERITQDKYQFCIGPTGCLCCVCGKQSEHVATHGAVSGSFLEKYGSHICSWSSCLNKRTMDNLRLDKMKTTLSVKNAFLWCCLLVNIGVDGVKHSSMDSSWNALTNFLSSLLLSPFFFSLVLSHSQSFSLIPSYSQLLN